MASNMLRAAIFTMGGITRRTLKLPTITNSAKSFCAWKFANTNRLCYYCTAPGSNDKNQAIISKMMGESQKETAIELNEMQDSWKKMKTTLILFGITFACIGSYLIFELGKPKMGPNGIIIEDEYSRMPTVPQYLYRTFNELNNYKRLINEPSREKLLPDELSYPYYQPPYTVVLELTDVLVHPEWTYNTGWRFKKRPGMEEFLDNLNGLYEVVVYTAEMGMTVFPIIEALDPKNVISYKLVRDATHFIDGHHVKDLDRLNRKLNKVIVVDWNEQSTKFHQDNVLRIPRWSGNDDDTTLIDLAAFLKVIAHSEIDDVRDVLKNYRNFEDPLTIFKERQRQLAQIENQRGHVKR